MNVSLLIDYIQWYWHNQYTLAFVNFICFSLRRWHFHYFPFLGEKTLEIFLCHVLLLLADERNDKSNQYASRNSGTFTKNCDKFISLFSEFTGPQCESIYKNRTNIYSAHRHNKCGMLLGIVPICVLNIHNIPTCLHSNRKHIPHKYYSSYIIGYNNCWPTTI